MGKISVIYSFHLWRIFSLSNIIVLSLNFLHRAGEHVFCLVDFLCISALFVILILSISAHYSLTPSDIDCPHLFFLLFFSVLYSVPCLDIDFIALSSCQECLQPSIHFFLFSSTLFWMISIAAVTKGSLIVYQFEFPFSFCP